MSTSVLGMKPNRIDIGIEGEFLILDKKGKPCPAPYSIPRDNFDLLAEIRSDYGTPGVAFGSFVEKYNDVVDRFRHLGGDYKGYHMSTKEYPFTTEEYWENVLRCATSYSNYKEEIVGGNIYGNKMRHRDIDGHIYRGGGLHIHISANKTTLIDGNTEVNFVFSWAKRDIEEFVRRFEKHPYIKSFLQDEPLNSYRQKGFWRLKDHGFEYRSLPMNAKTFKNLFKICRMAHNIAKDVIDDVYKY